MDENDIRNAVKIISQLTGIKQQRFYCFRTKKLTLMGTLSLVVLYTKVIEKMFQRYEKEENETNKTRLR